MVQEVWDMNVPGGFVNSLSELRDLLVQLQIPVQPVIMGLIRDKFEERPHFSYMDFLSVLEQSKSIHLRWVAKLKGKHLDDDLLEAFVAVGGKEDSGGEVDLQQMRTVVQEFQLQVDLDRILKELDSDGNANIDFGEFADLLRENAAGEKGNGFNKRRSSRDNLDVMELDTGLMGIRSPQKRTKPLLSVMEFFDPDAELQDDGTMKVPHATGLNHPSMAHRSHRSIHGVRQSMFGASMQAENNGRLVRQSSMQQRTPKDRAFDTPDSHTLPSIQTPAERGTGGGNASTGHSRSKTTSPSRRHMARQGRTSPSGKPSKLKSKFKYAN
jgi:Ca2+-binding EF-hand superfamily protein